MPPPDDRPRRAKPVPGDAPPAGVREAEYDPDDGAVSRRRPDRPRWVGPAMLVAAASAHVVICGGFLTFLFLYGDRRDDAKPDPEPARTVAKAAPPISPKMARPERPAQKPLLNKADSASPPEPKPAPEPDPDFFADRPLTPSPTLPKPITPTQPAIDFPKPVIYPPSEPRPKKEVSPGYYQRKIHGFLVAISRMSYDESDAKGGRPLGYVEQELGRIADLFDPKTKAALAKVPIWIEWDHIPPGRPDVLAVYYGMSCRQLSWEGVDQRKAKCVVMTSLRKNYELHAAGLDKQLVLLHEVAHAVHDQVHGFRNPMIRNAYDQAMTRRLYLSVRGEIDGRTVTGYAATSPTEYFAELTCLYLDRVNYFPTDRDGLRQYDSVGYELMAKVWGNPDEIETRKKKAGR